MKTPSSDSILTDFIEFLRLDKKDISYLYLFSILSGLIGLSLPLGIQGVISIVSLGRLTTSWYILLLIVILGILLVGILQVIQIRIVEVLQQRTFSRIAFDFAERLVRITASNSYYLPHKALQFMEVTTIQKSLSKILLDLSAAILQIFFGILLVSLYHPLFAVMGSILLLVTFLILYVAGKKGIASSIIESKYKYKVVNWLVEIGRVAQHWKYYKQTDYHLHRLNSYVEKYIEYRNKHFAILTWQYYSLLFIKIIFTLLLFAVGGVLVIQGEISIGEFVGSEIVIVLILNSVEKIILSAEVVYDMLTAVDKLLDVMHLPMDEQDGKPLDKKPIEIELQKISLQIADNTILQDIDIHIIPQTKIVLGGKGNSGKSSLCKVMAGIKNANKGRLLYNGIPVKNVSKKDFFEYAVFIDSKEDVLNATVWDNITIGTDATMEQVLEVIQPLHLLDNIQQLPDGWDEMLLPAGKNVSESFAFKLIIARALVNKPSLLIIDADVDFLPMQDAMDVWNAILSLYKGTLIIVSSNRKIAKDADQIILLETGKVSFDGTYNQLINTRFTTYFT